HITTPPTHGTATVNPTTGEITYIASAGFAGTDLIRFTVTDSDGLTSSPAQVNEVVSLPTNNPSRPGLSDTFGTTDSGFAITIDVLAGATDPGGTGALVPGSVSIVSGPANGTASIDPSTGEITYTSVKGFNGTDNLTYTVKDHNGAVSNVAQLTIV